MIEGFQHIHPAWTSLVLAFAASLALLFARRVAPAAERGRGKATLIFLVLSIVLRVSALPVQAARADSALAALDLLAVVFLALGLCGLTGVLVFDLLLGRAGVRVASILRDLIQAGVFLIVVLGLLRIGGVNIWSLVTTSAVLTAVVGLALQDTIANLFSGLTLQMGRCIAAGDWVQVGTRVGRVDAINWRFTALETKDGDVVVVPNRSFIGHDVVNFSRPTPKHRAWCRVGFHYRHAPNQVRQVLLEAVSGVPGVLDQPPPDAFPVAFGESAVEYALRYWIRDFEHDVDIDGEVRTRIWYAAQRAGLEIPFPIRTVQMGKAADPDAAAATELLERTAALSGVDLFRSLHEGEAEILAAGMRKVAFACGEAIIRQGEPGDSLYFIARGEVAVKLNASGVEREVATLAAGEFFGEMSLVTGDRRSATCLAKTDVSCLVIGHEAFQRLLDARPEVAEEVSAILASRQVTLEGQREGLSVEAQRRATETRARLLERIRSFFRLRVT